VFNITHQDSLDKYLGCPAFKGRPNTKTLTKLVNETTYKLQTWKTKNISKAGRVTLIQANVESMLAHTIQCFQLSSTTNRNIERISRNFFWKKSDGSNGLPMVS